MFSILGWNIQVSLSFLFDIFGFIGLVFEKFIAFIVLMLRLDYSEVSLMLDQSFWPIFGIWPYLEKWNTDGGKGGVKCLLEDLRQVASFGDFCFIYFFMCVLLISWTFCKFHCIIFFKSFCFWSLITYPYSGGIM